LAVGGRGVRGDDDRQRGPVGDAGGDRDVAGLRVRPEQGRRVGGGDAGGLARRAGGEDRGADQLRGLLLVERLLVGRRGQRRAVGRRLIGVDLGQVRLGGAGEVVEL